MKEPTCHQATSLSLNGRGVNNTRGPSSKDIRNIATPKAKQEYKDKESRCLKVLSVQKYVGLSSVLSFCNI